MPLDSGGYPQTPTDIAELGRRVVQLERAIQLGGGARSLVQASVGRGGIRVTKGGSVTIESGGAVVIEKGDLVLGEGKIDGLALKNQIEAAAGSGSSTGKKLTNSWATYASASVKTPSWATRAIIQGFGVGRNHLTNSDAQAFTIHGRLRLAGTNSAENLTPATGITGGASTDNFHNLSWETTRADPPATITVEYQLKAEDAKAFAAHGQNRADVACVVIFMR